MRNTPRRDNGLELSIRRLVFAAGMRYRVDFPPLAHLRRRGDLVFVGAKVVVFLDGCFWHCCPRHATWPKSNRAWWRRKLLGNVARDRDTDRRLREAGWLVLRFWEHCRPEAAARRIVAVVAPRTAAPLKRPQHAGRRGARATARGSRQGT